MGNFRYRIGKNACMSRQHTFIAKELLIYKDHPPTGTARHFKLKFLYWTRSIPNGTRTLATAHCSTYCTRGVQLLRHESHTSMSETHAHFISCEVKRESVTDFLRCVGQGLQRGSPDSTTFDGTHPVSRVILNASMLQIGPAAATICKN